MFTCTFTKALQLVKVYIKYKQGSYTQASNYNG